MTREDRLFLLAYMVVSTDLREQLDVPNSRPSEIWVTIEEADELREQLGDLLQTKGFDTEYRPTAIGKMAEQLLDKLFTG
jgi:hypothetical protein